MNRKHVDTTDALEQQNGGEYTVKSNFRVNIIAAAICLMLAVLVWIMVMNRTDSDYLSVCVTDQQAEYSYELSADVIKVEGKVADLRLADEICIRLPENAGVGEYKLSDGELELVLPDGVYLSVDTELIVTVKAK